MIRAFPHRHIASVTVRTGTCASLKEQNLRLVVEKYGSANDLLKNNEREIF
ncbi:unknown [Prevotella sp. CAG:487]|nr:unknown [Prevotella sp. CAG:487]